MKYNRYLVIGITLLTIMLLFLFSGVVSETGSELFGLNALDQTQYGHGKLLMGIGLPLVFAAIYVLYRSRSDKNSKNK
ncbi:hypothetical protein [Methanolobus sp. WCC5]|jgi:hypothetical protein|uniref:hypothetical protein n=1 Tax=Methanolobus sp. WCC5 TaxID=3125785 RepID=UPI0032460EA1